MRGVFIMTGTLFALSALIVSASDALLKEAITEDRTLGEISSRIKDINGKQVESNVFSDREITAVKKNSEDIDLVKNDKLKVIIDSLGKTVAAEDRDVKKEYGTAKTEYREALGILEKISSKKLEKLMQNRELLDKQKGILKETEEIEKVLKEKKKITDKDIEKLAELAEKQEALKNQVPDEKNADAAPEVNKGNSELKNKMEKATEALKNMKTADAKKAQNDAIKDLEKKIKEETENEKFQAAGEMNELNQMRQDLNDIKQALQNSLDKTPLNDQQRQDLAQKMNDVAQEMKQNGMQDGKQEMNKAMENTIEKKDAAAMENVNKAVNAIQKAMKDKQVAAGKQPPGQKSDNQPGQEPNKDESKKMEETANKDSKESSPKDSDLKNVEKGKNAFEAEWKARLPEKERDALLSARKAKFNPKMEDSVKRYFIELAKE